MRLLIHTDGAARGNPGPAGAGAILRDAETRATVAEIAEPLAAFPPDSTCNAFDPDAIVRTW